MVATQIIAEFQSEGFALWSAHLKGLWRHWAAPNSNLQAHNALRCNALWACRSVTSDVTALQMRTSKCKPFGLEFGYSVPHHCDSLTSRDITSCTDNTDSQTKRFYNKRRHSLYIPLQQAAPMFLRHLGIMTTSGGWKKHNKVML